MLEANRILVDLGSLPDGLQAVGLRAGAFPQLRPATAPIEYECRTYLPIS